MTKAQKAFDEMVGWNGGSEIDLYPYVREVFTNAFGYPRDHIRLTQKGTQGKIPDVSLVSADVSPRSKTYWVVGEVKKERGAFRSAAYRTERWTNQLKNYVTADTVYALFIDPITVAILKPDGSEVKTVELDKHPASELLSSGAASSLASLLYEKSVCDASLVAFKEGVTPTRYLDVEVPAEREKFYEALRISARELIDYSASKLSLLEDQYDTCQSELKEVDAKVAGMESKEVTATKHAIRLKHKEAVEMFEGTLKEFESQIGRQVPKKEEEAKRFLQNLYATEGSSLVLARILFVRFFEDHGMTMRKISNGGIKAFRQYHQYVKDDYQFLLTDAYKEAEHVYRRLFEPSVFDWSHKGNGQLSRLLLRIFYRLNAFDFTKITGDILGNLYERFLDIDKRKKLGEYYTPMPIAQYVLERIGFFDEPGPLMDPACGSGTFLIAAATGTIDRLTKKGVQPDLAVKEAVNLVHGLDINMFAAFIAQLQMIWHLLPTLVKANVKELPDLKIYGGVNSLEWLVQDNLMTSLLDLKEDAAGAQRAGKYRYIVGNPPYIRNERLKDTGPWRENYDQVEFRNSDVSYFFVARAIVGKEGKMPSWLDDGGKMCFVLPRAIADSDAASTLREKLLRFKIFEVTDLEDIAIHIFPSPQASGRATVAPILLFIEKKMSKKAGEVGVVSVSESGYLQHGMKTTSLDRARLSQDLFKADSINPNGQMLMSVKEEDIPVLKKLMTSSLGDYMQSPTPTYGVKVGGGRKLSSEQLEGLLPIGKGLNISTFFLDEKVDSWVEITQVEAKSIWAGDPSTMGTGYAVSEVALAPQCAAFSPSKFAFNNTVVIFIPKKEFAAFPWDVLVNSSIIRFVHLLSLRTALIGVGTSVGNGRRASWCHLYPRVVSEFPVPKSILEDPKHLAKIADGLRKSAAAIGKRWEKVDEAIASATTRALPLLGADFTDWQGDLYEGLDLKIEQDGKVWLMRPYDDDQALLMSIRAPHELLKVTKYMIEALGSEPTAREVQQLQAPENFKEIAGLIERAEDPQSPDIKRFRDLHTEADETIADGFGLTKRDLGYIRSRLDSRPMDVLQPRWPWKTAERRVIQEYSVDRFV